MKMDKNTALLKEQAVAQLTGMSIGSVRRWRLLRNQGPRFIRVGKSAIRYRLEDVETWLANRPTGGENVA